MICGHPADVFCTRCDGYPRVADMTERQKRIAWLDAAIFGLHVHGRTDEDRARAAKLGEELNALRAEERAS